MILVKCGTCGTSQGYKTAADGALSLPAAEEQRLVRRGVASYVTKPIIGPNSGAAALEEGGDGGGQGDNLPELDPASTGLETGESEDSGEDEETAGLQEGEADDCPDIVDGHFTRESLMQMKRSELDKLAEDCGLDISRCRNKGDVIALLMTFEVPTEDDGGETPPDLDAEAPIVGFKASAAADVRDVFLHLDEFAERRTVEYDGERYEDIPVVLSGLKEQDRRQLVSDHAQGLYLVSSVLHCAIADLGGKQPEKGSRIRINDEEGGGGFFREFYVASSVCEIGMLRVELEAVDE